MNHKTLIILIFLATYICKSQTVTPNVIASQGGYSQFTNSSISWSIGESIVESYNFGNYLTTMGFHQPELEVINLIQEQGNDKNILVFPNPVKDILTINFSELSMGIYGIELMDNLGKLIIKSETEVSEQNQIFQLKINEVAEGNYFLKINNKSFTKTVKINKIN